MKISLKKFIGFSVLHIVKISLLGQAGYEAICKGSISNQKSQFSHVYCDLHS